MQPIISDLQTPQLTNRGDPTRLILFFLIATPLACATGIWGTWSWLVAECARLSVLEIVGFWLSTIVALLWFIQFGAEFIFGRRWRLGRPRERESRLMIWLVCVSFFGGIATDSWITIRLLLNEREAYARAIRVEGQVVDAKVAYSSRGHESYKLSCRFQDRGNNWHDATIFLQKGTCPPPIKQAVIRNRLPFAVPIAYDPARPGRNWLAGVAEPDRTENRLPTAGLSFLTFSLLAGLNLIFVARRVIPVQIAPFIGVTIPLLIFGLFRIATGWR